MRIFYGAGHEQFAPDELLRRAQLAEEAAVVGAGRVGPAALRVGVPRGGGARGGGVRRRRLVPRRPGAGVDGDRRLPRGDEAALEGARKSKGAQPPEYYVDDWHDPQQMYEHAEETISDDEYREKAIISADPAEHAKRLGELKELGATTIAVMNCSGADPEGAIRVYGERVLPKLR